MALHFERAEYLTRIERARAKLRERDLAALLIFAQESHYYLTGFDTSGFVFFQCTVLTADPRPVTLLTRLPDPLSERAGRPGAVRCRTPRAPLGKHSLQCNAADLTVKEATAGSARHLRRSQEWPRRRRAESRG